MDYNRYINFRWGSEPQQDILRKDLAKKWMFIKPDVGNLSASPQVPFCSFNVIPYYGGYPTGFSTWEYCAWSTPKKCLNTSLKGFTHFSFSGCGDLHHFHNYFLIKPCKEKASVLKEYFSLNGFEIETDQYQIKVNVNSRSASYDISSKEEVTLIPGFNGLTTEKYPSVIGKVLMKQDKNLIYIDADYSFIHLYWVIKINKGQIINVSDSEIVLSQDTSFQIAFSKDSLKDAETQFKVFDNQQAQNAWEECFKVFDVQGEEYYQKLFYTALMFALKKPYIYDQKHIYDFATMWDVYKTLLPLIFLFYKKEASILVNNMLNLVNENGLFYHMNLFSKHSPTLSDQAICLMNISISTAALYGVEFDKEKAKELQKREIEYYLNNLATLDRTTYLLDLADAIAAYNNAYGVDLGIDKIKTLFDTAYMKDKVYLNKKKTYYEGNYSNYSFRVSASTPYRLINPKGINKALDRFFGFKGMDTIRFIKPTKPLIVKRYMKRCKRFEGLNNEPDMESMYFYSFFQEYGKQNKVIKDVIANSFSIENNGVPGNDDNGGLSSWLVFNLLGIFPVVGTNKLKIGLPSFEEVKAGKLVIKKHSQHEGCYDIEKVLFNGQQIIDNEITASDINKGGVLDIYLK